MSFQTPITIADALDKSEDQCYLLPAIQREFEWPSKKIEWLFDSLMRDYPISSFLFWDVEDLSKACYRLYKFLRVFRVRYRIHTEDESVEVTTSAQEKTAARKEAEKLRKSLKECQDWEREVVLPLAQQRIALDLDDGVKINYQNFPSLLAKIPGLEKKEAE